MADKKETQKLMPDKGKKEIIVRMYRQGLGDCFLLALPAEKPKEPRYLLVDCGVHKREDQGAERLRQVMDNLAEATGSHLNIVVATHEHEDHLSGFVQKDSPFLSDKLKIDQLWLAWTEKRGDRQADELRKKRGTAQRLIEKALEEVLRTSGGQGFTDEKRVELLRKVRESERPTMPPADEAAVRGVLDKLKEKASQDAAAWDVAALYEGAGLGAAKKSTARVKPSANELALGLLALKAGVGHTEYCEPGRVLKVAGVSDSDLRVYVLGPPREATLLAKDRPTKIRGTEEGDQGGAYKEVYLSGNPSSRAFELSPKLGLEASEAEGISTPEALRFPFVKSCQRALGPGGSAVPPATKKFIDDYYLNTQESWRRIDGDWLGAAETLALNLASDTNNSGLVLAFEWGPPGEGAVLLFPGDAQVGNWLSWPKQDYKAGGKKMSADDLLKRTLLYKVGHHGSHNATLRRDSERASSAEPLGPPFGLELMNDIVAMIPVDWDAAKKKMPDPWKMPHEPLYRRLREKAQLRVLRSDALLNPLDAGRETGDLVPEKTEWRDVPGLKGVRWRRSEEVFKAGKEEPIYYDLAIELRKRNDS